MYTFCGKLDALHELAFRLGYDLAVARNAYVIVADATSTRAKPTESHERTLAHAKLTYDRCPPDHEGKRLYVEAADGWSLMDWGDVLDRLAKTYRKDLVCPLCDSVLAREGARLDPNGVWWKCVSCSFARATGSSVVPDLCSECQCVFRPHTCTADIADVLRCSVCGALRLEK
jgi:hypothetical protein